MSNSGTQNFKYDIAISLCKEDVDFADKLVKAINPNLRIFFYEHKQEELISKSGPETFARVFKEESRIVVILARKEWSETFYTDIERSAIIDRIKTGFHFIMVIPMKQGHGETPAWYPETNIYVSPFKFTIEQLAKFIEFKVADNGGIVKPLTLEERYQNLIDRIEIKKLFIDLQQNAVAIENAKTETLQFKKCFNQKINFLNKSIFDIVRYYPFMEYSDPLRDIINRSDIRYGEYLLECQFMLPDATYNRIVTTQDFGITIELFKIFGSDEQNKKLIETEQRVFYYTSEFQGWALPHLYERATNKELQVLFRNRDNSQYYDLTNPLRTETLIDSWFQRLLSYSSKSIERYI